MHPIKKILFYIGNAVIGVFTLYAYLYFWMVFNWGDPFLINFQAVVISLFLSVVVFISFNYLLLKNESASQTYWWVALAILLCTMIVIFIFLAFI
ncbi:hypothetical protein [Virgibacillus sediminis]|uniref:Uncharacterized protein n=1 Tax=Virgibacillus sediminis TaxID=202260 RepID=A0ABV7A8Q4_9BACI